MFPITSDFERPTFINQTLPCNYNEWKIRPHLYPLGDKFSKTGKLLLLFPLYRFSFRSNAKIIHLIVWFDYFSFFLILEIWSSMSWVSNSIFYDVELSSSCFTFLCYKEYRTRISILFIIHLICLLVFRISIWLNR